MNVKKLFDIGSKTENPVIVGLPDYKQIAYCRDNFLFFQEYYGTVNPISEVKFSEAPLNIGTFTYCFERSFFLVSIYFRLLFV